jgi:hypothetical protein
MGTHTKHFMWNCNKVILPMVSPWESKPLWQMSCHMMCWLVEQFCIPWVSHWVFGRRLHLTSWDVVGVLLLVIAINNFFNSHFKKCVVTCWWVNLKLSYQGNYSPTLFLDWTSHVGQCNNGRFKSSLVANILPPQVFKEKYDGDVKTITIHY